MNVKNIIFFIWTAATVVFILDLFEIAIRRYKYNKKNKSELARIHKILK